MRPNYGAGQSRSDRGEPRSGGRKPAPWRRRRRRFARRPTRRVGGRRRHRVSPFVRQAAAGTAASGKRRGGALRRVRPRTRARLRVAQRRADHVAAARAWLARLGRREEDLICGPHPPISREAAEALIRIGREPSPLHNNCSGKHLGFLTLAMHLGAPLNDYGHPEHPVQREVRRVLSEMGGTDLSSAPVAGDGCGAPVVAMPLVAIARAFALLGAPDDLPRARATAARRVVSAMTAHPYFVGGTGRFDTLVTERAAGGILVKGGAEGVCAAALLERGLGFAVKIDDGAKRAAETAMAALLARWADGDGALRETIAAFQATSVVDTRSLSVGSIRPAPGWPS